MPPPFDRSPLYLPHLDWLDPRSLHYLNFTAGPCPAHAHLHRTDPMQALGFPYPGILTPDLVLLFALRPLELDVPAAIHQLAQTPTR